MTTKEADHPVPSSEGLGMSQEKYKEALDAAANWILDTPITRLQESSDALLKTQAPL